MKTRMAENANIKENEIQKEIKKETGEEQKMLKNEYLSEINLDDRFELREIRLGEAVEAAGVEKACFPPSEACSEKMMVERATKAPEYFLVAVDRQTGKIAGILNGLATDETTFRSVVFGPFSIVWGLGCAMLTWILYRYREQSDRRLFLCGTILGGAYEYICSVFTEIVFGTVFWDYSKIPFNLGGRINLLYCFFWGFAAIIWMKGIYPFLSRWIEKIPVRIGKPLCMIMVFFMSVNIALSGLALDRYSKRHDGLPAKNAVGELMDDWFPDPYMEKVYPNIKFR